jgi:hypothetical protein
MRKRVHDEFGAFANEFSVKRLARTDLRAKQFTLTERPLRDPGGCDGGGAARKRPEYGGHCTDDGGIHCLPSARDMARTAGQCSVKLIRGRGLSRA